jgi:hypothetical protein
MWFHRGKDLVLKATIHSGIYLISWIKGGTNELALTATPSHKPKPFLSSAQEGKALEPPKATFIGRNQEHSLNTSDVEMSENDSKGSIEKPQQKQSPSQILKRYQKYHRRLGHVGAEKLRNLHKVTKLEQRIIIPNEIPPCEVCRISKIKNRMNKTLSPWKADTLALIYVNACGPLPKSLRGNIYFSQIVDSSTRRV